MSSFPCIFRLGLILIVAFGVLETNGVAISEAEQMALEVSGVMLPPKKLTKLIEEQLKSIRKLYTGMQTIHHSPKWVPGELVVATMDENVIQRINSSRYGPLKMAVKMGGVGEDKMSTFHLFFDKPYHPARLVERMRSELGVEEAEGNLLFGDGNDITYHESAPTYNTYTFKMGWGNCANGCVYKHYWQFSVAPSQETITVKLEKEYGSDLNNQGLVVQP